ncbi:MAG: metalloregulator ArsR/SmtB family transcription factor [Acidimicrobiia bacterium]|nr:metalloregulator ArsR/SmtB family transcription factor [Acidimicrobiia bacterium]MDH4365922.1 metalloregulator ArsR/SmtB family transcription factor [Acidimicrobiia bacterium]MDH5290172.1 metalloregulator ArsR/SmtB family transcription factor [Acidimicrobiia bacterium]
MANTKVDRSTGMDAMACCAPVGSSSFDENAAVELARGFHALADPVRLHLLSMITAAGPAGVCVCDLVEPAGRSQPTVSHHLKILRQAGLVTSEKRGTWAWYHVRPERVAALRAALG